MSERKAYIINALNKIEEYCFKEIDNGTILTNNQLIIKGVDKFMNVSKKQQGSGLILVEDVQFSIDDVSSLPIYPKDTDDNY